MHILITGGCGSTGTILTNDLINLGHKVTVIDKSVNYVYIPLINEKT